MSICYGLRLTPCQIDPSANHLSFRLLFDDLIRTYKLVDYALGYEELNKYGEPTKPHYHFNFLCDAKKQAIQTHIRRWGMYKIKGNTMYCLTRHPEPDDFNRWFRYVAKEKLIRKYCNGFTKSELIEMELLAKDERARSVKYNVEKREHCRNRSTLYDRFSAKIKSQNFKTFRNIWLGFLKLYVEENSVVNPRTITGYTHLYMLSQKLITPEAFYDLHN